MFSDVVVLIGDWYLDFLEAVKSALSIVDSETGAVTIPEIWSAFVPWEQIIAAVILVTFIVCVFKFLRCVLCKML